MRISVIHLGPTRKRISARELGFSHSQHDPDCRRCRPAPFLWRCSRLVARRSSLRARHRGQRLRRRRELERGFSPWPEVISVVACLRSFALAWQWCRERWGRANELKDRSALAPGSGRTRCRVATRNRRNRRNNRCDEHFFFVNSEPYKPSSQRIATSQQKRFSRSGLRGAGDCARFRGVRLAAIVGGHSGDRRSVAIALIATNTWRSSNCQ